MLKKIIDIAEALHLNLIELTDDSKIKFTNCTMSLATMHILLNGKSWYNGYGFLSRNHKEVKGRIDKIRKCFCRIHAQFSERCKRRIENYF